MIKDLLIIDTVAIAICIAIIVFLAVMLYREARKNKEKTECNYTHTTKCSQVTTKSGLAINTSLTGWFCSHCGHHEEYIYEHTQYCPRCGRRISKFYR